MKSRAGCAWRLKFCLSAENNSYSLLFCSGLDTKLSFGLVLIRAVEAERMFPAVSRKGPNISPSPCISSPGINLLLDLLQQVSVFLGDVTKT